MSINVRIPAPLRRVTGGVDKVSIEADSVGGVIEALNVEFPGIKDRLCDDTGALRNFVNVYVNGEDVRFDSGLETATKSGDEVSIVPAVAGGS
jgi:molybdopterin synthase sulfur carrier subunit